ncbi:histidine phosphatase family protein [Flavobacterium terrae]|uniref:histidine phosphatase family protein n=1 Tax=Flavobacterium terrae TaxID=415425 RepID=UPI00293703CF|nr:histidine phosphatase family protein [Flavobacterium terrae]
MCAKGICYGQADVSLMQPYQEQFQEIKKQLPEEAFFYSSPLERCTILADFLSTSNFTTDKRLMEMDFGSWELKSWDEIPKEEMDPWMNDFVNVKVPEGESFEIMNDRVLSFIDEKLTEVSKPIVIVSHAGVIRSFLCKQMNLPLKEAFSNKVDFGQVIKINL